MNFQIEWNQGIILECLKSNILKTVRYREKALLDDL